MRINLTKKDLVNPVYMQIGFSKQIASNLIDDFLVLCQNLIEKKYKNFKIWNFSVKSRVSNW